MKLTIEKRQAKDACHPWWGLSDGNKFYEFGTENTPFLESARNQWQEWADNMPLPLPLSGTPLDECGPDLSKELTEGE